MIKEQISDAQGIKIGILFIFGSTLVMGTGAQAGRDMWLSVLAAVIVAIPVVLIYARILSLFPGKDLYEILELNLGKVFGKILSLVYIWFSFHLGSLILRNFGEFIITVALPRTPKMVPMIMLGFLCIWAAKAGIETIARCGDYFIMFVLGLILLYSLLAIPVMDLNNIPPIMGQGFKKAMSGIGSAFSYPFGETVVFLTIFSCLKRKKSAYKVYTTALIIGGFISVYIALRNITILGPLTIKAVYFPSYSAISRINVGNFIQRIEIGVTIIFLLSGFIKSAICFLSASKGVARLFGFKDYRIIVTPVGLLMINLSYIIYADIIEMIEWSYEIWPYYTFPIQVILPIMIWIFIELKEKTRNKQKEPMKDEALQGQG